jgi:hypothetical protein
MLSKNEVVRAHENAHLPPYVFRIAKLSGGTAKDGETIGGVFSRG